MISVAMTTYNGEKYIKEQIESILNQTKRVDEIIIFDDKSIDKTIEIIRNIKDNRIKLFINEINLGYKHNFYQAITKCSGEYIFLSDQDDVWRKDKVEKTIKIMKNKECSVICSNFELIDGNNSKIEKDKYRTTRFVEKMEKTKKVEKVSFYTLLWGNICQGATYCINRAVQNIYKQIKDFKLYHDYQLLLIGSKLSGVYFINDELIQYRIHIGNTIGFRSKSEEHKMTKEMMKKIAQVPMANFLNQLNIS